MTPALASSLQVMDGSYLELVSPRLLAVRFASPKLVLSDSSWNDGLRTVSAIANHTMPVNAVASRLEFEQYCCRLLQSGGLPDDTPLQLTAAPVSESGIAQSVGDPVRVTVMVSAGVRHNAVWAGDLPSFGEYDEREFFQMPGTINAAVVVDARLRTGVMTHIVSLVAEVRADVLRERAVRSCYSAHWATGTGTDSTLVVGDARATRGFSSASTHSQLGHCVAQLLRDALIEALEREASREGAP